jgi:hypothetical protein
MNGIVKWIIVTLVCTIFALDCIFLLSFKADAVAICQRPTVNFISNEKSDCTMPNFQLTHQSTNYPVSLSEITEIVEPSNPNRVHVYMEPIPSFLNGLM